MNYELIREELGYIRRTLQIDEYQALDVHQKAEAAILERDEARMKHTPGPWKVNGTRVYPAHPGIDCIATMQTSNMPHWDVDAKLIAAAPDLLAACIKTVEENGHLADGDNCTLIHLVKAIAKATGEQE